MALCGSAPLLLLGECFCRSWSFSAAGNGDDDDDDDVMLSAEDAAEADAKNKEE